MTGRDPRPPWAGEPIPAWDARAVCRGVDTRLFFEKEFEELGKRVCRSCPVRNECAAWALEAGDSLHGTWGALSWWDRKQLRQKRRAEAS